jgi:hypothetical protein
LIDNTNKIFTSSFVIKGALKSGFKELSSFMESFGGLNIISSGSKLCYDVKNCHDLESTIILELCTDKVAYNFSYNSYSIMKNISHMTNFLAFVQAIHSQYEFNYIDLLPYVIDLLKNCNISSTQSADDLLIERLSTLIKRLNLANVKLSKNLYDAKLEAASLNESLKAYREFYKEIYHNLTKKGGIAENDFARWLGVDIEIIKKLNKEIR